MTASVLLRVRDLKTYFVTEQGKGTARAVDDVSFDLYPGETLGIVGESDAARPSRRSQFSVSCRSRRATCFPAV